MKYTHWLRALCTLHLIGFILCAPMPTKPGEPSLRAPGRQHIEAAQESTTDVRQVQGAPGTRPTWQTVEIDKRRQVKRGEHADHMLEVQTVKAALKDQGVQFGDLHPHHQKKVREILNDRWNMQLVDGSLNIGKGSVTRYGLQGKSITPKEDRDGYTRETVAHGIQTAERMDRFFETVKTKHGKQLVGNVRETHKKAMGPDGANIIKLGEPTPLLPHNLRRPSSTGSSSTHGSSPSHPHSFSPVPGSPGQEISFSPKGTPNPKAMHDFRLPPIPSYAEMVKKKGHGSESPSPTARFSALNLSGAGPSGHGHARTSSTSSESSSSTDRSHSPSPHPHGQHGPSGSALPHHPPGHQAHGAGAPPHHPPGHGSAPSPLRITIPKRSARLMEKSNPKTPQGQIGGAPHTPGAPARPHPVRHNSVG